MTIGAAIIVIIAGLLIAAFLNGTIGWIVAVVGLVGLVIAVAQTMSAGRRARL